MTVRPTDALKLFVILFPAIFVVKYALIASGVVSWSLTSTLWQSALFAVVFSLFYTAYRKPKT